MKAYTRKEEYCYDYAVEGFAKINQLYAQGWRKVWEHGALVQLERITHLRRRIA